eukprot:CAMPEP_0183323390 /NCGR_PEP_ID=MMETSP0160_2-20130417/74262_1 /TAXON_ID=2839 ORGANISM="Odontella Sinensis, Strain Grunow 1884" /NCGR_SAMPLE_ID=MMETSP0160_2 /ASSEMBLY_ACC=CAM_ASM_000250 /LENGTH=80 /DNA_ID=CAMNT_0025490753 /DNA_START=52 /DNA_END=290 /DNA_ORIENTATION=-
MKPKFALRAWDGRLGQIGLEHGQDESTYWPTELTDFYDEVYAATAELAASTGTDFDESHPKIAHVLDYERRPYDLTSRYS